LIPHFGLEMVFWGADELVGPAASWFTEFIVQERGGCLLMIGDLGGPFGEFRQNTSKQSEEVKAKRACFARDGYHTIMVMEPGKKVESTELKY